MSTSLYEVYERLLGAYGPQHWWPGESSFEIVVGAVLTQNTSWKNVERAIENLREADLLSPEKLFALGHEELAELIRPAGYYRLKAKRLRNLLQLIAEDFDGSLEAMFSLGLSDLRERLLSVYGFGPETAVSIYPAGGGPPPHQEVPDRIGPHHTRRSLRSFARGPELVAPAPAGPGPSEPATP